MEACARITRPGFDVDTSEKSLDDAPLAEAISDRYELLEQIGKGGMGVVYRARHRVLHREFALKLLRPGARHRGEVLERMRREAQSAARAESPHVVQVTDFGELPDGSAYLAMEMLDGRELADELEDTGAQPWARTKRVALQICAALRGLHAQGIVHRDLKPENVVLIERDGDPDFVKLVDFGLARIDGAHRITSAGLAIGTPHYMSPEQCLGDGVDARSDIYSLGVLLYQMLAGRLPFEGVGYPGILAAQIGQPPDDVRVYAPELCGDAAALVMRCLEKDPSWRFTTLDQLADAIEAVDEASPSSSGVRVRARRGPPAKASEPAPTLPPASPSRVAAIGLALTAIGATAVALALAVVLSS